MNLNKKITVICWRAFPPNLINAIQSRANLKFQPLEFRLILLEVLYEFK